MPNFSPRADPSLYTLRLGVFADFVPPSAKAIETAISAGMQDVVLGIWSEKELFKPRAWTRQKLLDAGQMCADRGLLPHLMLWAFRDEQFLVRALGWLGELMTALPVFGSILLDCEGAWHRGFGITPKDAADLVATELRGLNWGVTGLPRLHSTVEPVASQAFYVVPQAYSFWKPTGNHWSQSGNSFPQTLQVRARDSWAVTKAEIVMGLACYWGNRPAQRPHLPALTAAQTMRACAAETAALGVPSAWYWSLKWLRDRSVDGGEVRKFFGATL